MKVNVYAINSEVVKFKTADDKKMRTSKIRYTEAGNAFFQGFNGIKMFLSNCISTSSMWGDKEAAENGIVGIIYI